MIDGISTTRRLRGTTAASRLMSERPSTFRKSASVLGHGLFGRFMLAEFVSMVGSWMQTQAQQAAEDAATPQSVKEGTREYDADSVFAKLKTLNVAKEAE